MKIKRNIFNGIASMGVVLWCNALRLLTPYQLCGFVAVSRKRLYVLLQQVIVWCNAFDLSIL
jgi:hypothetical protein